MNEISSKNKKLIERMKIFYRNHRLYSDTAIFILIAYISLFSIILSDSLPLFPIFDEIVIITRIVINAIYLLYIPGFILIKNYYFKDNDIIELFTLQIATSLASIIILGLIIPDFNENTIFWFLTMLCAIYTGVTSLIFLFGNLKQEDNQEEEVEETKPIEN